MTDYDDLRAKALAAQDDTLDGLETEEAWAQFGYDAIDALEEWPNVLQSELFGRGGGYAAQT